MPCKHAALAAIYAKQMDEMDEPWLLWRLKSDTNNVWFYPNTHFVFFDAWEIELIPKTIRIGNFDVPEPMREKPEMETMYWTIESSEIGTTQKLWVNDRWDNARLKLGLCHLTRDNCIAHAEALFSFSEIKE